MSHLIHCILFLCVTPFRPLSQSPKLATSFGRHESIEYVLPVPKHIPNHTRTESFQRRTVFTARSDTEAIAELSSSTAYHSSQLSIIRRTCQRVASLFDSGITERVADDFQNRWKQSGVTLRRLAYLSPARLCRRAPYLRRSPERRFLRRDRSAPNR